MYSTNNISTQIRTTGWRYTINDANYTVKYNETTVCVDVHMASGVNYSTSEKEFGADILLDSARNIDLRPSRPIFQYNIASFWLWIADNTYRVRYQGSTNSNNRNAFASWTYARK